jgi:hypothetical protein
MENSDNKKDKTLGTNKKLTSLNYLALYANTSLNSFPIHNYIKTHVFKCS